MPNVIFPKVIYTEYDLPPVAAECSWFLRQVRFGPDVEWVASPKLQSGIENDGFDYSVDPGRAASFSEAIRRQDLPTMYHIG